VIKRSEGDEGINTLRLRTTEYGYHYQFVRNTLQINQGNGEFIETGLMSGVAATDWSWSALFADFDQDSNQDLFVSNGIPHRPNDLDYIKYVSSEQIVNTIDATKLVDQKALSLMPSGKTQNYIFRGSGGFLFDNKSVNWLPKEKTCSTATAVGDLDDDGDLDLVVNNVDDLSGIYINQTNSDASFLKIKLQYKHPNAFGIGARVYSYHNGVLQFKELYSVRGFQASSEPLIHFGYGKNTEVDSIKVIWPNGKVHTVTKVKVNQTLFISYQDGVEGSMPIFNITTLPMFQWVDQKELGLLFEHKEDKYTDFDRSKLLPYQQSDRGPATAIGDINNDGQMDIYFGGSKHIPGQFYIQSDNGFVRTNIPSILKDSIKEDVEAVIADFNLDGKSDLFIGTGGADFYNKSKPLLDSYYLSGDTSFTLLEVADYFENASCLKQFDFDDDDDLDLFVGNQSVSNDFGNTPKSYFLQNEKGKFIPVQENLFKHLGMVTDAVWDDYDRDGQMDLVIIGEWMEPTFLKNNNGVFEKDKVLKDPLGGLWQSIIPFDVDKDGDMDYILGNWGLNSKFKASASYPMQMYFGDIDENGQSETILAVEKNGSYYPLDGFDMLAGQIVSLRKQYTSYESFAGKKIQEIFSKEQLQRTVMYTVHQLASGYLRNDNGKFVFVQFPLELQVSPLTALLKYDFDSDGKEEVLVGGNYFGVQPFQGRYGSFSGAMIKSANEILDGNYIGLNLFNQSVRHFNVITNKNDNYLIVTINNGKAQIYKLVK